MGLFGRHTLLGLSVAPETALPRDEMTARIAADKPIDNVTAARVEWGYRNIYRYRWAGKSGTAATDMTDALSMLGETGTNYGSNRKTDDWVSVGSADLTTVDGVFEKEVSTFRIPSWAPASSPELARWECRVQVERAGRDVGAHSAFGVLAPPPETPAVDAFERLAGSSTDFDVVLPKSAWQTGELVTGHVTITGATKLPTADVGVFLQRLTTSHPLSKTPSLPYEWDGPIVKLNSRLELIPGVTATLPFQIPIARESPPSADAVHSSLEWFVHARIMYSVFNSHVPERVRRAITVFNCPRLERS